MRVAIRTLQVPRIGATAFTPVPVGSYSAGSNGQNRIVGMPGTHRAYSPRPAALDDGELGGPLNQPSSVAPDWILPSVYYNPPNRSLRFPGKGRSTNEMPVPVTNVARVIAGFTHRVRIGGRRVTSTPRSFTQWPSYGGS